MRKIIYILALLSFLFVLIHKFYYEEQIKQLTQKIHEKKSKQIKQQFRYEVKKKFGRTFGLTYILSKDKKIIKALLNKDNRILDYKSVISEIEQYGEFKNLWIQIIDKDGYSFYRSWTNKVGDYAAAARLDIAEMIKNPRPMRGISTGRFDMTFKTMIPLYNEGKFIGMIEMISKFNSIAKILEENDIQPLMVLHEDYKKRFIKPFTELFIEDNYVANLNASKELMKLAKDYGIKRLMYLEEPKVIDKYLVSTDEIKDIHGGEMAFFIFFYDKNLIDNSLISSFKVEYFIKIIILLIIFILLFLYLMNRNYTNHLHRNVAKKTSKIKKQKERLKSLLRIYDQNVIFSKTDERGIITHASKAFCKISGYTKAELIGKPHNLVRHPDMPKEAFDEMWSTIKSGKTWKGEVKNLRKDGGFYWVEAEVEPIVKHKKIVGYSALRQDITDSKEIEEIQKEIIFTMGSIGESRSKETGNHVKRVAEYSKILALNYGLDEEESEMLRQASPMHDIGKVAISDSILKKPGRLNDEEITIMKTHAQAGYEMLKSSNRPLLKTAAIVALEHHEKWDGTGYPRGLKEEEIHIYGRITAIADVFDALGSNRCYKKAWEDDKIFALLKEERGKHFDPKLIDIFFQNLDEFLKIRNTFVD